MSTLAGSTTSGFADGIGSNAKFFFPVGVAVNPTTAMLYVGGGSVNNIKAINTLTGKTTNNLLEFIAVTLIIHICFFLSISLFVFISLHDLLIGAQCYNVLYC